MLLAREAGAAADHGRPLLGWPGAAAEGRGQFTGSRRLACYV